MAGRIKEVTSSIVGVEPWRSVSVEFPGIETIVVEEEKVAQAEGHDWPTSVSEQRIVVLPSR